MSEDQPGPAAYVVVEFSDRRAVTAGFERLQRVLDSGSIRLLDVELIRSIKGVASTVPASSVDPALTDFDAMNSQLLGQADLDIVVAALTARQEAAVVVYSPGPTPAVLGSWSADGLTVLREGPVEDADLTAARAKAGASVLRIAAPSSRM
ncbi:MAG TPA: hypothetical protein VMD51_05090 [Mycobacterium sp.]|nr:hypothetical protein [Mycobacterium sp.]